MTCRECQERLFTASRNGEIEAATGAHVATCAACQSFADALGAIAADLDRWRRPVTAMETEGARAALVARLTSPPAARVTLLDRPLLPMLLGAAATATGVTAAPDWARGLLLIWLAMAGLAALILLLQSAWRSPRWEEG
jgi:hypothetical protein